MTSCVPVGSASSQDKEGDDVESGDPFLWGDEGAAVAEVGDIEGGWESARAGEYPVWSGIRGRILVSGNAKNWGHCGERAAKAKGERRFSVSCGDQRTKASIKHGTSTLSQQPTQA